MARIMPHPTRMRIQGLEPCIEKIREMGHKPDFHIIGLNLASDDASARFKLSGSTGGSFSNHNHDGTQ